MLHMGARKEGREPSVGPSHRSAADFEAEFDELDRLAYGPRTPAAAPPDHLRLAPEPPRPAPEPRMPMGAVRAAGPANPEVERLIRKTRRAALFAGVMATFAFLASMAALLGVLVTLAA